ncbi:transcriptional factor b3 [Gigaspora margarita]|uniref:Transcriptional factor b3 n=1 Tax=Gigaspora margarita TaxID=4874 RepID=A0A8H3X4P0_GIGMA|nr:transcriptional factor b3 [Gigaspora margarita]
MIYSCNYCGAMFWLDEKTGGSNKNPIFSACCNGGKVMLPSMTSPPDILMQLLTYSTSKAKEFHKNIQAYNAIFAFTSLGAHIDESIMGQQGI